MRISAKIPHLNFKAFNPNNIKKYPCVNNITGLVHPKSPRYPRILPKVAHLTNKPQLKVNKLSQKNSFIGKHTYFPINTFYLYRSMKQGSLDFSWSCHKLRNMDSVDFTRVSAHIKTSYVRM